jgi:hypothetical protein
MRDASVHVGIVGASGGRPADGGGAAPAAAIPPGGEMQRQALCRNPCALIRNRYELGLSWSFRRVHVAER